MMTMNYSKSSVEKCFDSTHWAGGIFEAFLGIFGIFFGLRYKIPLKMNEILTGIKNLPQKRPPRQNVANLFSTENARFRIPVPSG